MASIGSLTVDLELLIADFIENAKKAQEQSAELGSQVKEHMDLAKEAIVGFGEAMAIDYFKDKIEEGLEYAESIQKVSEVTGASTDFIQKWNYAASQSGVSAEEADTAIQKFSKSLGSTNNQQLLTMFKSLGVTSTNTQTALMQFADGLSKVQDKTKQVADVTQAFGRSAMSLTPVLAEGSAGLTELGRDAQQLGIVMSGSLIENSVEAEHKLSALKEVLDAEWASVIAQNAQSIEALANALIHAADAIGKVIAAHPQGAMAALGALGGAAGGAAIGSVVPIVGTGAGALIGGGIGLAGGLWTGAKASDADMDLAYRKQQYLNARQNYHTMADQNAQGGLFSHSSAEMSRALADYQKQVDLFSKAVGLATHHEGATGANGHTLPQPKGPKVHDRSGQQAAAYEQALNQLTNQYGSLQEQLTADPTWKAYYQHQALGKEYGYVNDNGETVEGSKDKEIDDQLAAGKFGDKDSDLAKSRADALKKQTDINGQLQQALVNRQEDNALDQQALDIQMQQLHHQKSLLGYQLDMATTAEDRRKLQLQILDIETQEKQAALEAKLAADTRNKASADVITQDKQNITDLASEKSAKAADINKQNAGPLQTYLNGIPSTASEMNEALQNVATDGLGKLTDGLAAVITGTESLGKAFKDMATSIIGDIAKIAIEEAIVKPLGQALGGALSGSGSFLSSLIGHADGGLAQAGTYLVGERGPELMTVGASANIIPNSALRGMGGGSVGDVTINSNVSGVNDPSMVKRLSAQTLAAATPALLRMSSDNTNARSRQRKMR